MQGTFTLMDCGGRRQTSETEATTGSDTNENVSSFQRGMDYWYTTRIATFTLVRTTERGSIGITPWISTKEKEQKENGDRVMT